MTDPLERHVQMRRAVPRQPADWFGFYRFDVSTSDTWRCCRIVDMSPLGAALELFGTLAEEDLLDGPITISLELHAKPRNVVLDTKTHSARLGVEFVQVGDAAKRYLRSINGVRSRW